MNLNDDQYILLFECCQLVKGYGRTLLIDFQRQRLEFLDNEIYSIFTTKNNVKTIREILNDYPEHFKEIISEYFRFFLKEEYAFLCSKDEINFFPKLDLTWDNPAEITNCIIDFDSEPKTLSPYLTLINDLDKLGCENIQIRDFEGISLDFYHSFLSNFNKTIISKIELLLKYSNNTKQYKEFISQYPRIKELIIYSSPVNKIVSLKTPQKLIFTKQNIRNEKDCGIVMPNYFNIRLEHFLESQHYNTCLNRKVCIDTQGNIKNCPSLKSNFGNIYHNRITDIISNKEFTKIWKINKNKIAGCKDCEFRHICTDCRAYHKSDFSKKKPFKCTYNPYKLE